MKRLEQYRAAAIELALKQGATPENVKEIAGKMRMIDIAEYIKQNTERK